MAIDDFMKGLQSLGYTVENQGEGRLVFDYKIEVGFLAGRTIKMGLTVGNDFPLTPPSGPRVSPRLFPLHPGSDQPHPLGGVHAAPEYEGKPSKDEWEYWSRPHQTWAKTDRSVKTYMNHIRDLFGKIES